jgi:hypothetical protein
MKVKIFKRGNLEKNSMKLIGIFMAIMFIMYGLASLGLSTWLVWVPMIFGYFIGLFLFVESGFISWLKSKSYKSFDVNDVIVLLSVTTSAILIVNSTLLLNVIRNSAPSWLISFSSTTGVIVAGIGLILSLLHFFSKRFK